MFHKKLITLRSQSSMETLKEKTTRGLFWGGMNNVVQQGLGLLFGIILGRLLNPEDYGMIALILVFQLIATALQESGFKSAIGNLKEPQHNDYNSVFWFNIIVGVTCYVILFFVAPFIADYYHTPELVLLCRVAFLTIIFAANTAIEYHWCHAGVPEMRLLGTGHPVDGVHRTEQHAAMVFLTVAPHPTPRLRARQAHVPVQQQTAGNNHLGTYQHQRDEHPAGPPLHQTRGGQLQPGLSVE